jgi:hypothetical protein
MKRAVQRHVTTHSQASTHVFKLFRVFFKSYSKGKEKGEKKIELYLCECVGKRRRSHGRHSTVERDSMSSNATFVNLLLVAAPAEKRLVSASTSSRQSEPTRSSKSPRKQLIWVWWYSLLTFAAIETEPYHHCTISLLLTDCRGRGEPGRSACRLPWPRPLMHARQTANLHRVRVLELVRTQDTHASAPRVTANGRWRRRAASRSTHLPQPDASPRQTIPH